MSGAFISYLASKDTGQVLEVSLTFGEESKF